MSFNVGFTGSQTGMTQDQSAALKSYLLYLAQEHNQSLIFRHGDCVGADAIAHSIAKPLAFIVIHPPLDESRRAFCGGADLIKDPKPYLVRNHEIVDESDILLACPNSSEEKLRSGTWATIRYAISKNKPIRIYLPTGEVVVLSNDKESRSSH